MLHLGNGPAVTGLGLATLSVLAVLGPADGQATPNSAQVQAATLEFLNSGCGDECNHPFFAAVRRVRCTSQARNRARCSYEERVEHFYERRPRWRRAEHTFVYDAARSRWTMACRLESTGPNVLAVSRKGVS